MALQDGEQIVSNGTTQNVNVDGETISADVYYLDREITTREYHTREALIAASGQLQAQLDEISEIVAQIDAL